VNFRFWDYLNGLLIADLGRNPGARSLSRERPESAQPHRSPGVDEGRVAAPFRTFITVIPVL